MALLSVLPFMMLKPITKHTSPENLNLFYAPPDTSKKDSTVNLPYPFNDQGNKSGSNEGYESGMYLHKPANISTDVEYDGENNEYHINEKVGSLKYRTPESMSFEEYQHYDFDKAIKNYWRQRFQGESFQHQSNLVPQIKVPGDVFNTIFGSSTIDIKPQGSAELIFGLRIDRTDNMALPVKQRKTTTFDFQEKIQMNVTGQIGDKLKLSTSYNTEASFEFENKMKLAYEGKDDEIIRLIEAGNVSLPLTGSLINGSYSLFGIKTALQFGKLTVTNIFSQQKGKSQVIEVQGGAQVTPFEVYADQYEANRHFFLGHYFYDNYDKFLANLPLINSGININRIEVWVTNKSGNYTDARNVVAFTDLGEGYPNIHDNNVTPTPGYPYIYPSNSINSLNHVEVTYHGIRTLSNVSNLLNNFYTPGTDYNATESMRMLSPSEYTVYPALGYISLNSALNSDEVLAVAYEYTVGGHHFTVGEFSNTIASPNALILKLIKGTSLTPKSPFWKLMMKNIYSIGAYQVNSENFKLDVLYQNDKTGTAINFIPVGSIDRKPLIEVLNLDRLNSNLDPYPDGQFDFIDKVTINASNGRVIFPVKEPFGKYLLNKMVSNPSDSTLAKQYAYSELYDSTQSKARQIAEKNKFFMKGSYKSTSGSDIALNAMNIPQGSVKVSAGGVILTENQDYTVDYTLGRVKIINQGLLQSGTPIKISLESQSLFNIQSKTLMGMHLNYQVNKDFNLGGTILNLTERPLTQKVNIGDEPISNTIWGLDGTYRSDSRLITKLVDKLPFINTKAPSTFMVTGELAQLIPGHSKAVGKSGTSYIDDFEGSKSSIDLRSPSSWVLASTPQQNKLFLEGNLVNNLAFGFNRAKTSWYDIDPSVFYLNSAVTPPNISNDLNNHLSREVYEKEIWPNKQQASGIPTNIAILNLAFYPEEKGPYNYDVNSTSFSKGIDSIGKLKLPASRWGGIMRRIESNDFEAANIEFVEFWLMDPFVYDETQAGGNLYFNIGDISEDILRDGRKSFEDGFPKDANIILVDTTVWGRVPVIQSVVNAFDNQISSRKYQDIGLDGLSDADERSFFSSSNQDTAYRNNYLDSIKYKFGEGSVAYQNAFNDPSNDDYHYFRGGDYDNQNLGILDRYKSYNGLEANSLPVELSPEKYPTASSTIPNAEDINHDNTLSEFENYFQYKVQLRPNNLQVGQNYIVDKVVGQNKNGDKVNWYQFKIPLYKPDSTIGSISDFKSIRFMRMFLRGFNKPVVLRFATLELVRDEWRKYDEAFAEGGPDLSGGYDETAFDISAVNIEENGSKTPVNYVLPPGVNRVIDPTNPQMQQLNEQAMVIKVCKLNDGDARAAYKNVTLDVRQYKRLQMFVHAEAMPGQSLANNDLCVFIRMGSDYQDNYYEYEIPLSLTPPGSYNNDDENARKIVWPESNMFDFAFEDLQAAKQQRNNVMRQGSSTITLTTPYSIYYGKNRVTVVGNPNISNVRTIMIGIRNRSKNNNNIADDGLPKCAEIWVNELRLTDFDEKGGWAANLRMSAKLADFGMVTLSGATSTPGFGSIESKVNDRSKEETLNYDIASNFELGKFLPEKVKLSVPMFIGYSEGIKNPEYNPLDPDIPLKVSLKDLNQHDKDSLRHIVQDYTRRKSLNFTNVKLNTATNKPVPWNISNFAVSYSFSEQYSRNISTIYNRQKMYRGALTYNFNTQPKNVVPFKNSKFLSKPSFKLIKDFNFYYLPSQFSFMTDVDRTYSESQLRNIESINFIIPPSYTKDFQWNRIYDMKYDITKSLKFDFAANNIAKIDEPVLYGQRVDKDYKQEYDHWKDSVWTNVKDFGRTTNYRHNFNLNYTIPINKIPILNWLSASARYGGTYEWVASPRLAGDTIHLGNTIKNSNTKQINGQANMLSLYNKVPVLQRINQKYAKGRKSTKKQKETVTFPKQGDPPVHYNLKANIPKSVSHKLATLDVTVKLTDSSGKEITPVVKIISENRVLITTDKDYRDANIVITGQREKVDNIFIIALEQTARLLMCVKNINVTYSENNGTVLPGYLPQTQFVGMEDYQNTGWSPGFGFISGFQDRNFGLKAGNDHNWLTKDTLLNAAALFNTTKTLNLRATVEPLTGMKIDLTANRTTSENISEYYRFNSNKQEFERFGNQVNGSFSMTYNTWHTTFEKFDKSYNSKNFDNFKNYRITIAKRLANQRLQSQYAVDNNYKALIDATTGFPDGYGPTSQEVLIPAFLAAYSGRSKDHIALTAFPGVLSMSPNWSINYNGLTDIKFIKKYFRTLTIAHGYRSSYSVNTYNTSLDFNQDEFNRDGFSWVRYTLGNYIPQREINGVSISEQFSPLISFDGTMINSIIAKFEIKRSRNLSFGLSNNQVTEMQSKEYIFGTGYRLKNLTFQINSKTFKSDLNLRADLSIRNDFTIIRKLEIDQTGGYNQITAGQQLVTINITADYQLGPSFTLSLFYKRNVRKPKISTSFDTYNTNIGISVRFTLSQ